MIKNLQPAPVHISVYDRPRHFIKCIESLSKNIEAHDTTLYISSDGPKDKASADNIRIIRDYINNVQSFKKINLFAPKENTNGEVLTNVSDAIRSDSKKYIFSEDDNIFSKNFLSFVNDGLNLYQHNKHIFAICGYMFPGFSPQDKNQHFLRCFNGWGVGFWSEKNLTSTFDGQIFAKNILCEKEVFQKIINELPVMGPMLRLIAEGKIEGGDLVRAALLFERSQFCVFPPFSLVRNIGNDGSGMHCGINKILDAQPIYDQKIKLDADKLCDSDLRAKSWIFQFFGGGIARFRSHLIFLEWRAETKIFKFFLKVLRFWVTLMLYARNIARKIAKLPTYS
jgi:hypothetical protein